MLTRDVTARLCHILTSDNYRRRFRTNGIFPLNSQSDRRIAEDPVSGNNRQWPIRLMNYNITV